MDVDVSPDMQFYNLLESYPYSPTSALCEYIDNSLEAFKSSSAKVKKALGGKLKIKISLSKSEIVIRDHGIGITLQDLQRVVKPAYAAKKRSLSEFGIGMKAASIWFGRKWVMESYPINNKEQFNFLFDLDKLLLEESEKVPVKVTSKSNNQTGVKITLSKLKREINRRVAEHTWEEIQEIYQLFTSRIKPILEIEFSFDKTNLPKKDFSANKLPPLKYPLCKFKSGKGLYAIGKLITWKKDINFKFNGKIVHGFISLREKSSQTTNPGIRLFRYGRLIQGSENKPYRPVTLLGSANKHAPSRFYGELNLDGQPISNSKGEFVFDEKLFLDKLYEQEGVPEYIEQAENYRARLVDLGDVTNCKDLADYEKLTGTKQQGTSKKKKRSKKKAARKKAKSPVDILDKIVAPDDFLLLSNFIEECSRLYREGRWWPFCLCYRVLIEVSIIHKLKKVDLKHYNIAKEKSVVGLFYYLHSNSNIIPSTYKSFKKNLKAHALEENPFMNLLNLASHGHYAVIKPEVDNLLQNTQQAIEWAFSED